MEDSSPRLVYNPDDGSVMVQTSGPAVTIDGLVGDLDFERISSEGDSTLALWLDAPQAEVLGKMIQYIIDKVSIRPESKQLLADLLPQVEALVAKHEGG